ncbi:DNA topoisomerase I [Neptunomonas sp.]|uniref:DNA topoisomerase I n=1 Tax=Neptunomonas sp. TaxID=1971898 RepID=UPI0025F7C50B|nr:DNA topoisomerase I [Neptunomonas sp.]
MMQDNLVYIVIIALIGAIALGINYFISQREHNSSVKHDRLDWLRKQTFHTLDAIATLKAAGCKPEILEKLNSHAMVQIEEISLLAPDSDLMTQVNNQKETADRTAAGQGAFNSDKELKRFQIYINFTEKLLSQMLKKGKLSPLLAENYGQELYWLNISIVAEAHINQAKQFIAQDEKLTALSHLKHAKAVIVRAMVPQNKKQPKLDIIQPQIDAIQPRKSNHGGALEDSIDNFLK